MNAQIEIKNKKYNIDFSQGIDISIPLCFNGEQPNTYGVNKASSIPYEDGQFVGDTRKGGPCNFETYSFTPHCNGTHTECIGHITRERVDILSSLNEEIIASTIVSILPKKSNEKYVPELNEDDLLITREDLKVKLKNTKPEFLKALIIRTLPNFEQKKNRNYMAKLPPFLSVEAMNYIVSLGVEHLLIDTPSVDRLFDQGHLSSHNIFWETKQKEFNVSAKNKTITEMIFVPSEVKDGRYLLNLQIPAFVSDAAPSRPVLYKINDV